MVRFSTHSISLPLMYSGPSSTLMVRGFLFGLFGTDRFRLAVSADGSAFFDGLIVDNANGIVDQPRLPRFKGYTNYDNYVAVDTWTKIGINNTEYNDQGAFDAGSRPVTRTGDWSDVTVVDADGNRIPWTDVSHIRDDEMRDLMRDIVNRINTFHLCADEPGLQAEIDRWMTVAGKWDEPEIDQRMIGRRGARPET